jgi:nicotinate phosphoribosyltransferase
MGELLDRRAAGLQGSLVCKVSKVNGHPAVKLSDNYEKATGPAEEVGVYREAFGTEGVKNAPVRV